MLNKIHSIEQLEKEKEKLRTTMQFTREAFSNSLQNTQKLTLRFLIKNVAVPTGALGLGVLAAKSLGKSRDEQYLKAESTSKSKTKSKNETLMWLFKKIFPIALNMLQAYLLKKQSEKVQSDEPEEAIEKTIGTHLKSVS